MRVFCIIQAATTRIFHPRISTNTRLSPEFRWVWLNKNLAPWIVIWKPINSIYRRMLLSLNLRNHFWMWLSICLPVLVLWWIEYILKCFSFRVIAHITHWSCILNHFNGCSHSLIIWGESRGHMMVAWAMMRHQFVLVKCWDHIKGFSLLSLIGNEIHICVVCASTRNPCHLFFWIVGVMKKKKRSIRRSGFCTSLSDI